MDINQYKTKDLAESAALITVGMHLLRIDKQGSICWFIFDNKDKCINISNQFFFGELTVNARAFWESVGRLKHRIFAK